MWVVRMEGLRRGGVGLGWGEGMREWRGGWKIEGVRKWEMERERGWWGKRKQVEGV